ncbi:MAG: ankyrin repeat domain-containing protein [Gemmatimonadales bacterium]
MAAVATAAARGSIGVRRNGAAQRAELSRWPRWRASRGETARFLLEHGMNPNRMNWHRFTLLHHMAAAGELAKAKLLIDHGADIDAIDDEYRSTPLGVAARWGRSEMVSLLLERWAGASLAGSAWALPLAWAEKKGHGEIAARLATV